jgi:hypothetical protein
MAVERLPFTAFCVDVLGLQLTAPWVVLLKVSIDGVQPRDLEGDEREVAAKLYGPNVDEIDPRVRRVAVWRLGRGSGKTTIAAALCAYEAWTADVSRAGPGALPTAFLVGPSRPLARIGFTIVRELVRASALARHVLEDADTRDGFLLRRPDGRAVAIRSVAASRGGANLRGVDVIVLVLDESEFFASGEDGDYQVTDRDQVSAVMPRLLSYVLCLSTPWPTDNLTAETFDANYGRPTAAVAVLGPSMLMRPSEQLAQDIERERARDPENCEREYFCQPGPRGGSHLFIEGLREAVVEDRALTITAPANAIIGCGGDLGLERDSSAIAIVSRMEDAYELAEFDEVRPQRAQPLSPRYVVRDRFAPIMRRHGAQAIVLDAHYRMSSREHLEAVGLDFVDAPAGQQGKYDVYMFTRGLLRSGKLKLPNAPRLLAQMRAVVATPQPGGGTRITSPRRAGGGHGDVVSALVLAAWQAAGSPTGRRSTATGWLRWIQGEARVAQGLARRADSSPVALKVPAGISTVQGPDGTAYRVEDGCIQVRRDQVAEFAKYGFRPID